MAVVTKTREYGVNDTLTAPYYNADRDEIISGVNSIVNAQIAPGAAIDAAKINGTAITLASSAVITTIPDSATITVDGSLGGNFEVTLGASRILALSLPQGKYVALYVTQGGTGSYTFTGTLWTTTIRWVDGVVPTLTTTVGKTDVIVIYYNGTSYFGFVAGQNF